jgi:glycosyltransferase involved in cell wall biosynthesis
MKLIYHHRTEGDGAEGIHIREMIRAFRANGDNVKLVSITDRGEETGKTGPSQKPMELKKRIPPFFYELGEIGYNLAGVALLLRETLRERPDFLYERYSLFNLSAGTVGKWTGTPTVLEVNSPLSLERSSEPDETLRFRKMGDWFEKEAFRRADGIIAVSSPMRDYIVSMGTDPQKVLVLANGVDEMRFSPREKSKEMMVNYGIGAGKKVIGFSGIFRSWHGIDILIDAFASIHRSGYPVHMLLIGDGPMRGWIEEKLAREKLTNACTITGRVPHSRMPEVASLMDIAVSPRATFYASPMKLIEYMALAKAVVAPATENIRDILTDREDGILFADKDPNGLAVAIVSLIESEELYGRVCRNARRKVETRLNWRSNARIVNNWVRDKGWKRG